MQSHKLGWRQVAVAVALIAVAVVGYIASNMEYLVEPDGVVIRGITQVTIPMSEITEVVVLDKAPAMHRNFGISVLNVRQGRFTLIGVGKVNMYASNITRRLVVIRTADATYAITPKDPESFVAQLPSEVLH